MLELSDVLDVVNKVGDKPFREMVSLFARVVVKVYGGRVISLMDSLKLIGESSMLAPILVKAYFKEDGALAEITTALEVMFDGASSREIASVMIPFLVKAYLIKRKVFERCEARERASLKEMGTNVLLAFRKIIPTPRRLWSCITWTKSRCDRSGEIKTFVGRVKASPPLKNNGIDSQPLRRLHHSAWREACLHQRRRRRPGVPARRIF